MHKTASAIALLAASGAFALANTGPAAAAAKQRVVVDRFSEDYAFAIDCGDFGPYGFDNEVVGHQRVAVTDVLAADGTLLQTVLNIGLTETDANSVTGETLRLKGAVHEVWDYAANTRTISGKVWSGTVPGEGAVIHDVGRIRMTLDTNEVLFVAGPHSVFFSGGIDPVVSRG